MTEHDRLADPITLLPQSGGLRTRLARVLRDVDILRGLLRLSESVDRRDGRPVDREGAPSADRLAVPRA